MILGAFSFEDVVRLPWHALPPWLPLCFWAYVLHTFLAKRCLGKMSAVAYRPRARVLNVRSFDVFCKTCPRIL